MGKFIEYICYGPGMKSTPPDHIPRFIPSVRQSQHTDLAVPTFRNSETLSLDSLRSIVQDGKDFFAAGH